MRDAKRYLWPAVLIERKGARLLLVLMVSVVCGLGLTHVFLRHVGQDQAWCLYAANLVIHGTQLSGPELVEVNPPFIIWFSCLPVLFSKLIHQETLEGFRIFFDLLVLVSVTYTSYLVRKLFAFSASALWLCFGLLVAAHFWLIYGDSLGQREQLLVLFLTPYLVWAAARRWRKLPDKGYRMTAESSLRGLSIDVESIMIGLFGAIGVCLKPQHLLVVLMVEGLLCIRSRSWQNALNSSFLTLGAGLIAYAASVFAFGRAYIDNTVPLLRLTYSSLNKPYLKLLSPTVIAVLCILLVCWVATAWVLQPTNRRGLSWVFGVAAIASVLAYFQQHKGWSYQFIPAGMFTLLFLGFLLLESLESQGAEERAREPVRISRLEFTVAVVVCFCCMILNLQLGKRADYFTEKKKVLAGIFAQYPSGVPVSYIAVEPWEMPLVMEQHKVLGQRLNYFWLLPAIILNQDPANRMNKTLTSDQVTFLSEEQRRITIEDIERWKPSVVVFDQCGPSLCEALEREGYGNLLGWYLSEPSFARVWSAYRPSSRNGDLEAFRRVP